MRACIVSVKYGAPAKLLGLQVIGTYLLAPGVECSSARPAQHPLEQDPAISLPCLLEPHSFPQSLPHFSPPQHAAAVLSALLRLQDFASLPLQHAALSFPAQQAGSFASLAAVA